MKNTKVVYLDNASTTKIHTEVFEAMMPYMENSYGNPSSIHSLGREARIAIESARRKIAELLQVLPAEIVFTSGGTESMNTCLAGILDKRDYVVILTSKLEHHATLHTVAYYERKRKGIKVLYVPCDNEGNIDIAYVENCALEYGKDLIVCLMAANNEIGTCYDTEKIGAVCKEHQAIYIADMVQLIGHYSLNLGDCGAHMATASAHKFHGPKGIGISYICSSVDCSPFILGGSQERSMRAGTEYVAGIVGMSKALEIQMDGLNEDRKYISELKHYLAEKIISMVPNSFVLGNTKSSLYTVLNVAFPKVDAMEMLIYQLDMHQIAVSSGSACGSGTVGVSHVIEALGIGDIIPLRFSFSVYNTKEEMDAVVECLGEILPV